MVARKSSTLSAKRSAAGRKGAAARWGKTSTARSKPKSRGQITAKSKSPSSARKVGSTTRRNTSTLTAASRGKTVKKAAPAGHGKNLRSSRIEGRWEREAHQELSQGRSTRQVAGRKGAEARWERGYDKQPGLKTHRIPRGAEGRWESEFGEQEYGGRATGRKLATKKPVKKGVVASSRSKVPSHARVTSGRSKTSRLATKRR